MLFHRVVTTLAAASATLYTQCAAQEARRLPALMDRGMTPVERMLERRDVCADGGRCFIGSCCGDGCAYNCCGEDNGGVGCGITESCDFDGNVFIGCCDTLNIGGCYGTATRITINTPYRTVTFSSAGSRPTADTTATTDVLPSTRPTAGSSSSTSTAVETSSTKTRTTATAESSSSAVVSSESVTDVESTTASATATASESSLAVATTTQAQGAAAMVTAFIPGEVNLGAMAMLGAWMAL